MAHLALLPFIITRVPAPIEALATDVRDRLPNLTYAAEQGSQH